MSSARPRGVHAAFLVLLPVAALGAACGSSESPSPSGDRPSAAVTACRKQWSALGDELAARPASSHPSALASRWNTLAATVDYYAETGTAKDCTSTLAGVRRSITAETALSRRVAAYDLELRLDQVREGARAYAAHGRRTKPKAPRPAAVGAALRTLTAQAPLATRQQQPAWQQVEVLSVGDARAVAKGVEDLAFLSAQSAAYRAGTRALATMRSVVKVPG